MLEWTICNDCGKILDSTQTTCPNCEGETEKIDIDYLAQYLTNLNFLVNTISIFREFCPSVKDLDGVSLEGIILDDLFKWFSYLGLGDEKITDNELEFINTLLNSSYTKDDILDLTGLKLDTQLPLSFKCLCELDAYGQQFDMHELNSCNELFACYKLFGKFLITCDNELNEDVLKLYSDYIENLESQLEGHDVEIKPIAKPQKHEKEDKKTLDDYLAELNKLVGLENVKKDVKSLINLVQIRKIRDERGIKQPPMSLHLVFSGNPGTGKTTVARLLSNIYREIGVLSKGHLVETDRSGLVGGYVG